MTSPRSSAAGLRLVPVTDLAALEARAEEWSALLARSATNRPTQSPLWQLAWWRVFGGSEGRRLATALVYDGPRLVGLAPFLRRVCWHRHAIPFRRIELLATGEQEQHEIVSDYIGVIAERDYEEPVSAVIARAVADGTLGPCDEIVLTALDGDQPIYDAVARALGANGMRVERRVTAPSSYAKLPGSWEAYLAGLSSSGRYLVTRSLRDFERWAGPGVELRRVRTPADLEQGKRILVMLHEQRWKAAGQAGVFASRLFSSFHDQVMPALLERDALDLSWLEVRGQPVVVSFNLVWDNKVLFYQGGRTLEVPKQVRPGIVLHARSIQAAIEAGRIEYDFLAGASRYKIQLSNATRPLVELRATQAPLRDLARAALERGAAYVRQRRAQAGP